MCLSCQFQRADAMDGEQAKRSRARMIGMGVIVFAYGLAIGLRFIESEDTAPSLGNQASIAREAVSAAPPELKPVPSRRYPLTLANDPAAYPAGVINAFHQEWDRSESDSVLGRIASPQIDQRACAQ